MLFALTVPEKEIVKLVQKELFNNKVNVSKNLKSVEFYENENDFIAKNCTIDVEECKKTLLNRKTFVKNEPFYVAEFKYVVDYKVMHTKISVLINKERSKVLDDWFDKEFINRHDYIAEFINKNDFLKIKKLKEIPFILITNNNLNSLKKEQSEGFYKGYCYYPLFEAIKTNKKEIIEYLIEKNFDIENKVIEVKYLSRFDCENAYLCSDFDKICVKYNGIDILYKSIIQAIYNNNIELINYLFKQSKNKKYYKFNEEQTDNLIYQLKSRNINNIDVNNESEANDLFKAVQEGDFENVKKAIESGIDVNIRSSYGNNALMLLLNYNFNIIETKHSFDNSEFGHDDYIEEIIIDNQRRIAEIAQYLINCGINVNAVNIYNKTAMDYAILRKNVDIIELIETTSSVKHQKK